MKWLASILHLPPGGRWLQISPLGALETSLALLGGCGSLISAEFHLAVFSVPNRGALFSSLVTVIVWPGVLGVRSVLGLGCSAKAQSGMTPKLIMCLAVGRDP